SYLHTPLARVDYQGLCALEANAAQSDFHDAFNELFYIESDVTSACDFHEMELPEISVEILHRLATDLVQRNTGGRRILAKVVYPFPLADRFPDCYEVCKQISPFASAPQVRPLRVAIHVRRGELFVVSSERMLPNRYFLNAAQNVADALETLKVDYQ